MADRLVNATATEVGRRVHRRQDVETVLSLAQNLRPRDRLLIEQVYRHGLSASAVARLSGQRPGIIRRRIRMLLQHMQSPLFRFAVAQGDLLPAGVRQTARLVALRRHSLRDAARLSRRSLHQVRQDMRSIRALARL